MRSIDRGDQGHLGMGNGLRGLNWEGADRAGEDKIPGIFLHRGPTELTRGLTGAGTNSLLGGPLPGSGWEQ